MCSPNYWEGQTGVGNEHIFFFLKDCKNPEDSRGFYNEFLEGELTPHRKVLEMLSSKLKADYSDDQLSGIGFSKTKPDTIQVRVKGTINRTYNIKF